MKIPNNEEVDQAIANLQTEDEYYPIAPSYGLSQHLDSLRRKLPIGNPDDITYGILLGLQIAATRDAKLREAIKVAMPYLRDHIALTPCDGPGDRIALDRLEEALGDISD